MTQGGSGTSPATSLFPASMAPASVAFRTSPATVAFRSLLPPVDKLYTNQFVGNVKLTDAEWNAVEARSAKYLPKKPG